MFFGSSIDEDSAHSLLDCALDAGVNFIDMAEMYPYPSEPGSFGACEEVVGRWVRHRGVRSRVVLATKIAGPSRHLQHIRGGKTRFDRATLETAVHDSLRRLQTDHIDLLYLHWPERSVDTLGRTLPGIELDSTPLPETCDALLSLQEQGKILEFAVSNESAWGWMKFLAVSRARGSNLHSIQHPFNLINRRFEHQLAEISLRERCPLVAYATLANGLLTGKYEGPATPEARFRKWTGRFERYQRASARTAASRYAALAHEAGLAPIGLAIGFVLSRSFVGRALLGASTVAQLEEQLQATPARLPDDLLRQIDLIDQELSGGYLFA